MTATGAVDISRRNNVTLLGNPAAPTIVFAHGFGCSQEAWRDVVPFFTDDFSVVLFDHVGAGASDSSAYDHGKYDSLDGYAGDVLEILEALDVRDVVLVGHSVGAMIGVIAANLDDSRIKQLVLVGPSPRYVSTDDYVGAFDQEAIDGLLDSLDSNYLGWSAALAPVIVGNPDRPELGDRLTASFCSVDPTIARQFARVTFLSDNRRDLDGVTVPTLVLQSRNDVIAPEAVGQYVHERIRGSELVHLESSGHLPGFADPEELATVIRAHLL